MRVDSNGIWFPLVPLLMTSLSTRTAGRLPRLPLLIALLVLAIFTLTRLGLAIYAGADMVPLALWPGIFGMGLWFDVAVVAFVLAPICLYEALLPNRWRASHLHGVLRLAWLWLSIHWIGRERCTALPRPA